MPAMYGKQITLKKLTLVKGNTNIFSSLQFLFVIFKIQEAGTKKRKVTEQTSEIQSLSHLHTR